MPFSKVAVPIHIPTNSARRFPFLHTLSSIYYLQTFDDDHSDWCEVISHCTFICISLIMSNVEHLFMCLLAICMSFFYSFFLFIYLFTLQYCIGFAILQHESATGVHVFPILNPPPTSLPYHPSGSSQCTSLKHPVSCIEPRLVIHFLYDIIHVSMPFSQIIPPSPSPTESKRLFYTSVSLFLSCIQGYCYHLSKFHIYALVYCIGVFLSGLLHSV